MPELLVRNGDEAIFLLGNPRLARKRTTIQIREPHSAIEVVVTGSGPQEAVRGTHYVAKGPDGNQYPYDIEAFKLNMEEVPEQPGYYRKITASRLIAIPLNIVVLCVTIDQGKQEPLRVSYPDYIGVGAKNEVYPVRRAVVESDFDWIN